MDDMSYFLINPVEEIAEDSSAADQIKDHLSILDHIYICGHVQYVMEIETENEADSNPEQHDRPTANFY
jgi:hypothetical protein